MKINKMNTGNYLIASTSILIAITILMFVCFTATSVFSVNNDSFNMTVDIGNTAPTMSNATMVFNDTVTGTDIILTASENSNIVSCNATASDVNGWQDIISAAANFYHSSSTVGAANDKNIHYSAVNGTLGIGNCNLGSGSGNDVPIVCQIYLEHEATNGTWYCNITVTDFASATASNVTNATVAQLVAMTVVNNTLAYGSMSPDTNSSTLSANVTNEGNVRVGVQVNGTAMVCNVTGSVPITNIKYSAANDPYTSMATSITGTPTQVTGFTLQPEGISPFADDQLASLNTYWAIGVPVGVKGTCVGNVTVTAIAV